MVRQLHWLLGNLKQRLVVWEEEVGMTLGGLTIPKF